MPVRLPVVLSRDESQRLLAAISGVHGLLARLLYGTGMREMDCLRLRMKDMDFDRRPIIVRNGRTFERSGSCSGTAASIRRQFSAWSHHHRAGDAGSQSCVIQVLLTLIVGIFSDMSFALAAMRTATLRAIAL